MSRTMDRWIVMRADDGDHIVGHCVEDGAARVSSAIVTFDAETMTAVTLNNGRTYRLLGEPAMDIKAMYLWQAWLEMHNAQALGSVSHEYYPQPDDAGRDLSDDELDELHRDMSDSADWMRDALKRRDDEKSAFRAARGSATARGALSHLRQTESMDDDESLISAITPDNLNVGKPEPAHCAYCNRQASEYATLTAHWQQSQKHQGEHYELHICEGCFFARVVGEIERERWAETMYEDEPYQPGTMEREARERTRDAE